MFGKKKIKELERRIEALENMLKVRDDEAVASRQKDRQKEAVTVAQVMDEWFNGKKEGAR